MKTTKQLVEICCVCGFVHRDDRFGTRQRKLHFHWTPVRGELQTATTVAHATVCLGCLLQHSHNTDRAWRLFRDGRLKTDPKYLSPGSCNAPLMGFVQADHPILARLERLYGIMAPIALENLNHE